ncbi:AraC family transcriptional regulator [Burkholderia plantarii]|uniref:AraC family transcriptional regulator n=1 Tax=Burkholderia plantarii TaxID=41899 RepID=UPI0006D88BE6|nr:AraC family transcriptional regulator [Burkholderia plantarii]ALK33811.1 AraC family transcriptional regulator [Burkholderia plantarii]GLZ19492.1 AraC family transcriptional regulator [Burkholderia plantarii]
MDALSEMLSMLRVSSALSSRFEGHGAWAFRFPSYRHVKFGSVLRGQLFLWMDGESRHHRMEEGDFYLLTDGAPFCSASDPALAPADGVRCYREHRGADDVVRYVSPDPGPGSLPLVSLSSGRFTFENELSALLLAHLPPLIHLRAADVASHALGHVLALVHSETETARPGADVARASLATLVLVHALRAYLATSDAPAGWLGALADARIGRALSLMHASPAERWTVDSLAAAVGMSRTAFAQRFRRRVGSAPLEYLQAWRMSLAMTALSGSDESLARIAERVGYLSDTAFSIAFKRSTGESPGRFRSARRKGVGEAAPA